jgi:hypothetical protein
VSLYFVRNAPTLNAPLSAVLEPQSGQSVGVVSDSDSPNIPPIYNLSIESTSPLNAGDRVTPAIGGDTGIFFEILSVTMSIEQIA